MAEPEPQELEPDEVVPDEDQQPDDGADVEAEQQRSEVAVQEQEVQPQQQPEEDHQPEPQDEQPEEMDFSDNQAKESELPETGVVESQPEVVEILPEVVEIQPEVVEDEPKDQKPSMDDDGPQTDAASSTDVVAVESTVRVVPPPVVQTVKAPLFNAPLASSSLPAIKPRPVGPPVPADDEYLDGPSTKAAAGPVPVPLMSLKVNFFIDIFSICLISSWD